MLTAWCSQEAEATNKELLDLPDGWEGHDTRQILAVISAELGSQQEATRLAALHWMTSLFKQSCSTVRFHIHVACMACRY